MEIKQSTIDKILKASIEPNSSNIYDLLLSNIAPENLNGNDTITIKQIIKSLLIYSKKWDKEIDRIINTD